MDLKLEDLIAHAMKLPPEDRRYLAKQLAESAEFTGVREQGASSSVLADLLLKGLIGMTSVTVVLPDDLAKQAQAAGRLAEKPMEELIRSALKERSAGTASSESTTSQRRQLVRRNGRLIVEALPGEESITDPEVRKLLNHMEW